MGCTASTSKTSSSVRAPGLWAWPGVPHWQAIADRLAVTGAHVEKYEMRRSPVEGFLTAPSKRPRRSSGRSAAHLPERAWGEPGCVQLRMQRQGAGRDRARPPRSAPSTSRVRNPCPRDRRLTTGFCWTRFLGKQPDETNETFKKAFLRQDQHNLGGGSKLALSVVSRQKWWSQETGFCDGLGRAVGRPVALC
jgi:hypothetical protein